MEQESLSKTEKCILKFKKVHGDRYNYDKVVYIKNNNKVIVTCRKHGDFLQTPANHKRGQNCPKCYKRDKFKDTIDIVLEKFRKIHGDRYNYDKVKYINSDSKIIITCKEHGDYLQTPNSHKRGSGCPECGKKICSSKVTDSIVEEFRKIHGDRYNYDKVKYVNSKEIVTITCKEHGDFLQTPNTHKSRHGCPKCSLMKKSTSDVIEEFRKIHGDKFNYDKVKYNKMSEKVIITCKEHGDFLQTPNGHKKGNGCKKCREYHSYYRDRDYYKGKKTILYHIFLPEYNLYKVGLTISSVKQRFKYDNIEYEILSEEIFNDGSLAFDKEQKILKETKEYEYLSEKILKSGNTELRTSMIV